MLPPFPLDLFYDELSGYWYCLAASSEQSATYNVPMLSSGCSLPFKFCVIVKIVCSLLGWSVLSTSILNSSTSTKDEPCVCVLDSGCSTGFLSLFWWFKSFRLWRKSDVNTWSLYESFKLSFSPLSVRSLFSIFYSSSSSWFSSKSESSSAQLSLLGCYNGGCGYTTSSC